MLRTTYNSNLWSDVMWWFCFSISTDFHLCSCALVAEFGAVLHWHLFILQGHQGTDIWKTEGHWSVITALIHWGRSQTNTDAQLKNWLTQEKFFKSEVRSQHSLWRHCGGFANTSLPHSTQKYFVKVRIRGLHFEPDLKTDLRLINSWTQSSCINYYTRDLI